MGSISVFVDSSYLGLFVALSGMAIVSGLALVESINEEDAGAAWIWGTVFWASSLGVAWSFWRLL
jgi:hypothetical protein